MACPYFEPVSPLAWTAWPGRLRPPLGAPYDGVCRAGAEPTHPERETLTDRCNMGYAGRCPRFRPGRGEAVRFAVAGMAEGGVVVRWLLEADGLPVAAGELSEAELDGECGREAAPELVRIQSQAYLAAFRAAPAG